MPKNVRPEMYWIESRKCYRKKKTIGGTQYTIEGKTQDDVRKKLKNIERLHKEGVNLDNNVTLQEFAQKWFAVKTAGMKPNSKAIYERALNIHIAPFFKNMKLSEIKPLHIKEMLALKADYSKSLQSKILMTLNQIMKEAQEDGIILKNPCAKIKPGGYETPPKVPLTKEQQTTLVTAVRGKRCELYVLLCLYAGLRREEALGLMWENVHLDDVPYIDVRHTVVFTTNQPIHSSDLKSKAAYRSIPIPHTLSEALREHKEQATSNMVVPLTSTGGAISKTGFKNMWSAVNKELSFYVTSHLLRHTFVTELCAGGLDIKKVQYLAGHASIQMTLEVYAHATQNKPEELSATINKIFS